MLQRPRWGLQSEQSPTGGLERNLTPIAPVIGKPRSGHGPEAIDRTHRTEAQAGQNMIGKFASRKGSSPRQVSQGSTL